MIYAGLADPQGAAHERNLEDTMAKQKLKLTMEFEVDLTDIRDNPLRFDSTKFPVEAAERNRMLELVQQDDSAAASLARMIVLARLRYEIDLLLCMPFGSEEGDRELVRARLGQEGDVEEDIEGEEHDPLDEFIHNSMMAATMKSATLM